MNADFEALVDQAIAKCKTLTPDEARHFVEHVWVVVKGAISRRIAADIVACAWRELEERGIRKDDPETWKKEPYIRTGCPPNVSIMASRGDKEAAKQKLGIRTGYGLPPESPLLQEVAPRALGAQVDCVGGRERAEAPERIKLPDSLAVNLCSDDSKLGEEGFQQVQRVGIRTAGITATFSIRHNRDCYWDTFIRICCLNQEGHKCGLTPLALSRACWHGIRQAFIRTRSTPTLNRIWSASERPTDTPFNVASTTISW